jgi:hypothetical protein
MIIDPLLVKHESEAHLEGIGAEINPWLPHLDAIEPRSREAVARRALVLNALVQIYFEAPFEFLLDWLDNNSLISDLSESEKNLLHSDRDQISKEQIQDAYWSIESLWAFMWILGRIPELQLQSPVQDTLAGMLPSVKDNDRVSDFIRTISIRSDVELFKRLDLYYRAHWYARDANLKGKDTGLLQLPIIMYRRKALEWTCYRDQQWDFVDLST